MASHLSPPPPFPLQRLVSLSFSAMCGWLVGTTGGGRTVQVCGKAGAFLEMLAAATSAASCPRVDSSGWCPTESPSKVERQKGSRRTAGDLRAAELRFTEQEVAEQREAAGGGGGFDLLYSVSIDSACAAAFHSPLPLSGVMGLVEVVQENLPRFRFHALALGALAALVLSLAHLGPSFLSVVSFFWPLFLSTAFFLTAILVLRFITPAPSDSPSRHVGEELMAYVDSRSPLEDHRLSDEPEGSIGEVAGEAPTSSEKQAAADAVEESKKSQ